MNWLKNIFWHEVVVVKTIAMPSVDKWSAHDQKHLQVFLLSEQGKKLIQSCRHQLFSQHVDACVSDKDATIHNASMKGANNILSHILWLATEDSISSASDAKDANHTAPELHESDALTPRRAFN